MDSGTVGRARSAVPLRHQAPNAEPGELIQRIEAHYARRGFPVQLRVADLPCFDGFANAMTAAGYQAAKPTLTQTASTRAMLVPGASAPAQVDAVADAGWTQVFLGLGFDPVDGASRVQALSRASGNLFASVRENGTTLAAGAISFSHGWASGHGMRTVQSGRGRGLAGCHAASPFASIAARRSASTLSATIRLIVRCGISISILTPVKCMRCWARTAPANRP